MLDEMPQSDVRVFVVWQSILESDWTRPGAGILRRVRDTRARQYWDAENVFPKRLAERMRADKDHPLPTCCETDEGIPWDLAAVYPPGAHWDEALPAAVYIDGPVWKVKAQLALAVSQVKEADRERRKAEGNAARMALESGAWCVTGMESEDQFLRALWYPHQAPKQRP